MTPVSVPHLFALASGLDCSGPERCLFCAAPCGRDHPSGDYLRDSFTGRDSLPCPGSEWVCPGCVLCLREDCTVAFLDGTSRRVPKGAMRCWSWLVTRTKALAGSKAHLDQWRDVCLSPPEPPFALVLSDSGQKHLLYRGRVCHSREHVTVTLEGEPISYEPEALAQRLGLRGRLSLPQLNLLFHGGALTEGGGREDTRLIADFQRLFPLLRLLGGCTPAQILSGSLLSGRGTLVCEENRAAVAATGTGDISASAPSAGPRAASSAARPGDSSTTATSSAGWRRAAVSRPAPRRTLREQSRQALFRILLHVLAYTSYLR